MTSGIFVLYLNTENLEREQISVNHINKKTLKNINKQLIV